MYRQFARKVGTSANSALIRYYLTCLKLSTLALARERTPSDNKINLIKIIILFPAAAVVHTCIDYSDDFSYTRQIRNHQVAPLHTCHFFNIVILVAIWHAMFKQLNNTIFRRESPF